MIRIDDLLSRKSKNLSRRANTTWSSYINWRECQNFANEIYLLKGHREAANNHIRAFTNLQRPLHKDFFRRSSLFGPGWVSNIGHIVNLSTFPKMDELSWTDEVSRTLFFSSTANEALVRKYSKFFSVHKFDPLTQSALDLTLRTFYLPMEIVDTSRFGVLDSYTAQQLVENATIEKFGHSFHLLNLDTQEIELGQRYMDHIGLDPSRWFATFHMRETHENGVYRGGDNVDPQTYVEAMKRVIDYGGQVVRIGNSNMTPLQELGISHERIVDYAHEEHQNDIENLFWLGACRFLVGTGSGPVLVPNEFGRPVLYTNVPAIGRTRKLRGLCLPQLLRDTETQMTLPIDEMLKIPLAWNVAPSSKRYTRIYNSTNDIASGIDELLLLTQIENKKYWKEANLRVLNFDGQGKDWEIGVPISESFLNSNQELLARS